MINIATVCDQLEQGKRARLPAWPVDMYIKWHKAIEGQISHDFIAVHSEAGITPWCPTQHTVLSKQWIILEPIN